MTGAPKGAWAPLPHTEGRLCPSCWGPASCHVCVYRNAEATSENRVLGKARKALGPHLWPNPAARQAGHLCVPAAPLPQPEGRSVLTNQGAPPRWLPARFPRLRALGGPEAAPRLLRRQAGRGQGRAGRKERRPPPVAQVRSRPLPPAGAQRPTQRLPGHREGEGAGGRTDPPRGAGGRAARSPSHEAAPHAGWRLTRTAGRARWPPAARQDAKAGVGPPSGPLPAAPGRLGSCEGPRSCHL